jgi:hypothetical protein
MMRSTAASVNSYFTYNEDMPVKQKRRELVCPRHKIAIY